MRPCGECTACCRSIAIHEFDKKTNVGCRHIGAGCSIYAERPEACQHFECAWLREMTGFKDASMRPDRCGVVAAGGPTEHGIGMYFYSVWKDATDEDRIQSLLSLYNTKFPILLIPHEGIKGRLFPTGETS